MYDELVKKIRHCATDPMHCLSCSEDGDGRCFARLMTQAADAIEERCQQVDKFAEEAARLYAKLPRWIPVTERLPEEKTYVIILFDTIAGKMAGVCFLYKDDEGHNCWTWLDRIGRNLHDIQPTHWMPLPKGPEEE